MTGDCGRAVSTIGFDADDTLWHNEVFYRLTEERFGALLADYAAPEYLAERLLAAERRNLGRYGFGIKGFVLSMIETAMDVTEDRVPAAILRRILEAGQEMLAHPVDLLPGVREAVEALYGGFRLLLITKGDLLGQERKLAQSGLGELFDGVEIVSDKTPEVYARVFAAHGDGAGRGVMAGNSMKLDVRSMIDAGGHGVYVPHGEAWALEHADPPEDRQRFHEIGSLGELPALVSTLN